MKMTVTFEDFINEFNNRELYKNNFSRLGLIALFDYIQEIEEETGEEIELDIIALCCDFGEDTEEEYKRIYPSETIDDENEYIISKLENGNILYRKH
ncbi:hypothetical protein [Brachyspira hyodysenteriae]|uniref:hypothetical protein n=1 Tax=Brachyspira hyodysenteriae TaxID=159 RepID=UPI00063DA874|nr:hypothetical protein [Brachyspira hyodysenteriae]KLI53621.1 hypothetical protein SZ42_00585 [Brachyspira hyodysenteriae]